jgi:hypothetical protein
LSDGYRGTVERAGPPAGSVVPIGTGSRPKRKPGVRARASSLALLIAAAAVAAGLVMVICSGGSGGPAYSGLGFGLLVFGVPLVAVVGAVLAYRPAERGRVRTLALGTLALLVLYAGMAAMVASVSGQVVRWVDPADHFGRSGTKVIVTLPDKCDKDVWVRVGSGAKATDPDVVCHGATWQVDGASRTGTVVIGLTDTNLPGGTIGVPDRVEAFVLGDKGYSVNRVGKIEKVAIWGGVPLWWLPAGVVVALAGLVVLAKAGWVAPGRPAAGAVVEPRQQ